MPIGGLMFAQTGAVNGTDIQKPKTLSIASTAAFGTAPGLSGFIVTYQVSDKIPLNLKSGNYNVHETVTITTTVTSSTGYVINNIDPINDQAITNSTTPGATPITIDSNGKFPDKQGDTPSAEGAAIDDYHFNQKGTYFKQGTVVTVDAVATGHTYTAVPTSKSNGQPSFTLTPTFTLHIRWNVVKTTGDTSHAGSWGAATANPGPTQVN
jgi:hypothetical protein